MESCVNSSPSAFRPLVLSLARLESMSSSNPKGLLGSLKHDQPSVDVVKPTVATVKRYNSPPPSKAAIKSMNQQNAINNGDFKMSGGAAALMALAGVTHAPQKRITVPSFGTSTAGPHDATHNSQMNSQQAWNLAEQSKYDSGTAAPKPLGNPSSSKKGGRRKSRKQKKKGGRGTRRR